VSPRAPKSSGAPTKRARSYVSQTDVPRHSVEEALRVAWTLSDEYGKKPTRPDVAKAMKIAPTSGRFKTLTGASIAYGFTEGGANAPKIALTDLGRRVVSPTEEGDARSPRLMSWGSGGRLLVSSSFGWAGKVRLAAVR
jgi:hypothetical protein